MPQDASTLPQLETAERNMRSEADAIVASVIEDAEVIHATLKASSIAQIVIALAAVVALLYFLR
ncbi:ATP synthase subunit b 3 (fragment) [Candidatus Sulfotelmatomonas gaucii]|uniref:ATP synthase subunit b 3 n=1 Tax=Candidatus Sulfuritelmatomonas gaucii TaxID=2043161 RepID=A0A2N9LVU8_9BACT